MPITVVNNTDAMALEFTINAMVSGSWMPMWSGELAASGQLDSTLVMNVSGYKLYQVAFFPVGSADPGQGPGYATTAGISDDVTVALNIDVQPTT